MLWIFADLIGAGNQQHLMTTVCNTFYGIAWNIVWLYGSCSALQNSNLYHNLWTDHRHHLLLVYHDFHRQFYELHQHRL